jgi:hypothetical protein
VTAGLAVILDVWDRSNVVPVFLREFDVLLRNSGEKKKSNILPAYADRSGTVCDKRSTVRNVEYPVAVDTVGRNNLPRTRSYEIVRLMHARRSNCTDNSLFFGST